MLSPFGSRAMQTFRKLPKTSPTTKPNASTANRERLTSPVCLPFQAGSSNRSVTFHEAKPLALRGTQAPARERTGVLVPGQIAARTKEPPSVPLAALARVDTPA